MKYTILVLALLFLWTISAAHSAALPTNATTSPSASASNGSLPTSSGPSCTSEYSCQSKDDTCEYSWIENHDLCAGNSSLSCCAYGLMCNATVCATNNVGAQCSVDSDCSSVAGEILFCHDKACTFAAYAGDESTEDNTACVSGLNSTSGVCHGPQFNQSCSQYNECDNGLYCDGKVCQYLKNEKEACTNSIQCLANMYCSSSLVCTPLFNVAVGGSCMSSNQCSNNTVCLNYKCAAPETEIASCSTSSDCKNGEICQCSKFTGESFCLGSQVALDNCASNNVDAYNCQAKYNCTTQSANEGSCFFEKCYSELEDIQSCNCDNADSYYGSCFYGDYCSSGLAGWAIALIIIGVILAVVCVVGVLFVALKPRSNNYESI